VVSVRPGGKSAAAILSLLAVLALVAAPTWGIVLHDDNEPADTPDPDVLGRWGYNANCVVVAPNFILTTRHQGPSGSIYLGENRYVVTQEFDHPSADIRVVRITTPAGLNANLATWAELYTDGDESGKDLVLGGYGKSRYQQLQTDGITYGYSWTTETQVGTQLRWGTNIVNGTSSRTDSQHGFTTQVLLADFDDKTRPQGDPTPFEAATAEFDSGGGWFIYDPSEARWELAGLTRGVEHVGETWFRMKTDPHILDPDVVDAVRISTYATWIYSFIRNAGDANGDLVVDVIDLTALAASWFAPPGSVGWYQGDFTGDGDVDLQDLTVLAANWGPVVVGGSGAEPPPGQGATVPEPTTVLLLLAAGTVLLKRR